MDPNSPLGGAKCWANPGTFLGTGWYIEACDRLHIATPYQSSTSTANLAYNYDRMNEIEFTWVLGYPFDRS